MVPRESGMLVTTLLVTELAKYVQYEYTAQLERELDKIAGGEKDSLVFLRSWWAEFEPAVNKVAARDTMELRESVVE
eukprot:2679695-Pleurochrysis_carterae.AAC.1